MFALFTITQIVSFDFDQMARMLSALPSFIAWKKSALAWRISAFSCAKYGSNFEKCSEISGWTWYQLTSGCSGIVSAFRQFYLGTLNGALEYCFGLMPPSPPLPNFFWRLIDQSCWKEKVRFRSVFAPLDHNSFWPSNICDRNETVHYLWRWQINAASLGLLKAEMSRRANSFAWKWRKVLKLKHW